MKQKIYKVQFRTDLWSVCLSSGFQMLTVTRMKKTKPKPRLLRPTTGLPAPWIKNSVGFSKGATLAAQATPAVSISFSGAAFDPLQ